MTVRTHSPLFLVAAVATTIANAAMVVLGRWRVGRSRPASLTGRTLHASVSSPDEPSATSRWVGGANLPGTFGRTTATKPLAVLELGPSSLMLRVRPKLLAGMFGASSITVPRSDDVDVFPVRARLGTRGVGVRCNGVAPVYFWTSQPEEVLQALASADWPVSWDERRYAY
jgi:hypothetical protein